MQNFTVSVCARLKNVIIGVTSTPPNGNGYKTTEDNNFSQCSYIAEEVPCLETKTEQCSGGAVTGRYLVVQLGYTQFLRLCEVAVTAAVPQSAASASSSNNSPVLISSDPNSARICKYRNGVLVKCY